jgi:hypothetical protein
MTKKLDEVICASLQKVSREYAQKDVVAPLSVFWFDKTGEWQPVIDRLKKRFTIYTYGSYNNETLTGPAIYIRTSVMHHEDNSRNIPILYLPGYSREELRDPTTVPGELKPLMGLYHRSVSWTSKTKKDWTLVTFLQSSDPGPGIAIKQDGETKEALRTSIGLLLDEPIERLSHHAPLHATYLHQIQLPDPRKQILTWIHDPVETEKQMKESGQWKPFCGISIKEYKLNPERDGSLAGATKLATQEGKWNEIWDRFTENPERYPNIPAILSTIKVPAFTPYQESWPQINEKEETELLKELESLLSLPLAQAQDLILELEEKHKKRRDWVWARIGKADLAHSLKYLSILVENSRQIKTGGDLKAQIERYADETWKIDDAVLSAIASVHTSSHLALLQKVIAHVYKPWLNTTIDAFQKTWIQAPPEQKKKEIPAQAGVLYFFIDGLRMDLGHRLQSLLSAAGYQTTLTPQLSVIPSITETAKPAVMPVASKLYAGDELTPKTGSGAFARIESLRSLLKEHGYQVIKNDELGDPTGGGWTEFGNIDHEGHDKGLSLAHTVDRELSRIEARIIELIQAGWEKINIVTDHGFIYLPGGMEKAELPVGNTEIKKGRCALLRDNAQVSYPVLPWFWDRSKNIACAPKGACFEENTVFDHGGLSPQEMVIPEITIIKGRSLKTGVVIDEIKWKGMRCKITATTGPGYIIDIREQPGDATSTFLKDKDGNSLDQIKIPIDGVISIAIWDDTHEGKKAWLVITDQTGKIITQEETTIGGR